MSEYGVAQRLRDGRWVSMTIGKGYTLEAANARCEGRDDLRPWCLLGGCPGGMVEVSKL